MTDRPTATPEIPQDQPTPPSTRKSRLWPALAAGLAGAVAVNLLNEGVRRRVPHAPRMEVIGERALSQLLKAAGVQPPRGTALYGWTLLADLMSNTAYYALIGAGGRSGALPRGAVLGLAAGAGGVFLPRPMGLGTQPDSRNPMTPTLTVAWYLVGGLVAGAAYRALSKDEPKSAGH